MGLLSKKSKDPAAALAEAEATLTAAQAEHEETKRVWVAEVSDSAWAGVEKTARATKTARLKRDALALAAREHAEEVAAKQRGEDGKRLASLLKQLETRHETAVEFGQRMAALEAEAEAVLVQVDQHVQEHVSAFIEADRIARKLGVPGPKCTRPALGEVRLRVGFAISDSCKAGNRRSRVAEWFEPQSRP